jgi:hypothetical protein
MELSMIKPISKNKTKEVYKMITKKSLQNQVINKTGNIDPYYEKPTPRDYSSLKGILLVALGIAIGMCLFVPLRSCLVDPIPTKANVKCQSCHNRVMSMTIYFERAGSKNPKEMSHAVFNTKSPRLLAAISVVETRGNKHIRGTGYKGRHDGAFQVNPQYHGKVPYTALGQALQSEQILVDLLREKGDIISALSAYGGDKSKKTYAKTILAELTSVP